jgi:hypothetical protein
MLKEARAPLGVPIHLYSWGPRRLGIISRGILFRIQRVVNYEAGLQFEKTEAELFTNEPDDIGLVRGMRINCSPLRNTQDSESWARPATSCANDAWPGQTRLLPRLPVMTPH